MQRLVAGCQRYFYSTSTPVRGGKRIPLVVRLDSTILRQVKLRQVKSKSSQYKLSGRPEVLGERTKIVWYNLSRRPEVLGERAEPSILGALPWVIG